MTIKRYLERQAKIKEYKKAFKQEKSYIKDIGKKNYINAMFVLDNPNLSDDQKNEILDKFGLELNKNN